MKKYNSIILLAFIFLGCSNKEISQGKRDTINKFIEYAENEDTAARTLISAHFLKDDDEGFTFSLHMLHVLFKKYGIPPERKWEVVYDTGAIDHPIFKTEDIIIPIHRGYSEKNKPENAILILKFDYTGHYLRETVIASYFVTANFNINK